MATTTDDPEDPPTVQGKDPTTAFRPTGAGKSKDPTTAFDPNRGQGDSAWQVLPPALASRYRPIRTLGGNRATVYLVAEIEDPDRRVVVKIYNAEVSLDDNALKQIQGLARRARTERRNPSVVEVLEWGIHPQTGQPYEVQEYVDAGDLISLARRVGQPHEGGIRIPPPDPLATAVVDELTTALADFHGTKLVHHDLKPRNVLVRTLPPHLDLVLCDFDLAVLTRGSAAFVRAAGGTVAYAAPEVLFTHEGGKPQDYWSLGMTIAEVVGRHPFDDPATGQRLDEDTIRRHLYDRRPLDLSGIGDARFTELCAGLLHYEVGDRWGAKQVADWLKGRSTPPKRTEKAGSPRPTETEREAARRKLREDGEAVVWHRAPHHIGTTAPKPSPRATAAPPTERAAPHKPSAAPKTAPPPAPQPVAPGVAFAGAVYSSRRSLADALTDQWRASVAVVDDLGLRRRFLNQAIAAFGEVGLAEMEQRWETDLPGPDRGVCDLIAALDPDREEAIFRKVSVARTDLAPLARALAQGDTAASGIFGPLYRQWGLWGAARLTHHTELGPLDNQWHEAMPRYEAMLQEAGRHGVACPYPEEQALAQLLAALADPAFETELGIQARATAERHSESRDFPWMAEIARADGPAANLATIVLAQPAAAMARETGEHTRRQEEERRRTEEQRRQRTTLTSQREGRRRRAERLPNAYLSAGVWFGGTFGMFIFLFFGVLEVLHATGIYTPAHNNYGHAFVICIFLSPALMILLAIYRAARVATRQSLERHIAQIDRRMDGLQ